MWHISNAIGCYSDKLGLSHKVVKRLFLNWMYLFSLFFRENVLFNLSDKAFDRPICEALLNQKYFNGIGNYLRAEILYRLFLTLLLTVVSIQICILNTEFLPIEKALPFHSLDAELEYCMPVLSLFPPPWLPRPWRHAICLWEHCHFGLSFQIQYPSIREGKDCVRGTQSKTWRDSER